VAGADAGAAEIVWSILPPLTLATDTITVTGIPEPCYDMGGDTFDYAVHGDIVHLAIFDALGHGMVASTLTAVALSACRIARRCGLDLAELNTFPQRCHPSGRH
jgi:sigma-B regulation protein RsbU (phosphoserine phosphatase)